MKAKRVAQFLGQARWPAMPVNLFFLSGRVAVAVIAFVLSTHMAVAGPHPNMYLNQAEVDLIKIKIFDRAEPWFEAYEKVMESADVILTEPLLSVTFQGPRPGSKIYYSLPPYCGWTKVDGEEPDCRDGQINDAVERADYKAAIKLGDSVRDLGLAYMFTGDEKYAKKATAFIRVWSVDSDTRMYPDAQGRIELFITLPGYFYGADLIWNYAGWDADEKTKFVDWVAKIGSNARDRDAGQNNFANWRLVLIASAATLLDNNEYFDHVESEYKKLVSAQMNGAGSNRPGILGWEYNRAIGLHYSLYAINAMIQGAEIMRHRNVNLYDYKDAAGRGLELALDFITPYAINPSSWNADGFKQNKPITQRDSMALYELAYSHYQKQSYLDAINRWGRPMNEHRVMGINTLTHANRFELNMPPTAPNVIAQPSDITVTAGEDAIFSVVVTGSGPLSYQWFRDGSAIADATNANYTVTSVSSSDNGRVYSSEVSNSLGTVSSSGAVLTVLSDTIAPTLVSAFAASDSRVDILFSEPVSASSAEDSANYQIDLGIDVTAASLSDDGRTVSLSVSQLIVTHPYTVQVSNVQDLAQNPNTIVALSSKTFTYRTADGFENGSTAEGWTPLTPARWSVVMDDGDMAYYLNTTAFNNLEVGRLGEYSLLSAAPGDFTFTLQARLGDNVDSNSLADYAVVFGFQDENNYYYVMFNHTQAATQLFKVVDGSRTELATTEIDWLSDNLYHSIEVNRIDSDISVRFDDNLIMSANDSTFGAGKVGVGSYNDSAYFDDVNLVAAQTADTVAPLITLNGDNPQTITVGNAYTELGANAIDNRDGNISDDIMIDFSAVDTTTVGSYSVRYNVYDAAGNLATEVTRMVNVTVATVNEPNYSDEGGGGGLGPLLGFGIILLAFRSLRQHRRPHR